MNFIKTFFLTTVALIILFMSFIISIDPYDKLGINVFGFETKAVAQSRENKYRMFENSKKDYKAFIMGSSAAHRYHTSVLENETGFLTYNYAVQHTTPEDYVAIIKHILSKSKPEFIFLQIDFTDLDVNYATDKRLYNSPLKKYLSSQKQNNDLFDNDYFTLAALSDSLRVIHVNLFGKARHIYLEDGNYIKEKIKSGKVKIKQGHSLNYEVSQKRIELLKEFRSILDQNKIEFRVITSPLSYNHIQNINANSHVKQQHAKYKKELKNIFGTIYDFQNETLKDFSSTKEFHNSTHPTMEFSNFVLKQVFSNTMKVGSKY